MAYNDGHGARRPWEGEPRGDPQFETIVPCDLTHMFGSAAIRSCPDPVKPGEAELPMLRAPPARGMGYEAPRRLGAKLTVDSPLP